MSFRLRFPELLEERGLTPYAFAKLTGGKISNATAYRLVKLRGSQSPEHAGTLTGPFTVRAGRPRRGFVD